MSYSNNPLLPKARADAVRLVVEHHLSMAVAARRSGIHRSTLWRWVKQWEALGYNGYIRALPTKSSRPHGCTHAVSPAVIDRIRYYRERYGRCAVIVHAYCRRERTIVSLATVRRVLTRLGFTSGHRKWKRHYRPPVPRPRVTQPGDFVQTDTVHLYDHGSKKRTYLYTVVDVYSRYAYTEHHRVLSQTVAANVVQRAAKHGQFRFKMVQADNGPEYGRLFEAQLKTWGMDVRHSRVRRPNDNAFIERFNRTIQEECTGSSCPVTKDLNGKVLPYLAYYNTERLHLGLQCRTPNEVLQRC